jgi:hypothetical protein
MCRGVLGTAWGSAPTLVLLLVLASCRRDTAPPMLACPSLTLGGWQWVAVVGPPGTVEPYERIELVERGEQLLYGNTVATAEGSFALRAARRLSRRSEIELVTGSGARFSIRPEPSEGYIDYDPDTFAVREETPGVMRFRGEIASTPISTPIERTWAVNWNTGAVAPIAPTPSLDVTFEDRASRDAADSAWGSLRSTAAEKPAVAGGPAQAVVCVADALPSRSKMAVAARTSMMATMSIRRSAVTASTRRRSSHPRRASTLMAHCPCRSGTTHRRATTGAVVGEGQGRRPPFGAGDGAGSAPPPERRTPDAHYDPNWWNADVGPVEPPS